MNGAKAGTLEVKDWTSHEWLHFVRAIPANMSFKQMEDLDNAFSFTVSGNSEVLTGWLIQAVSHQYTPAYERLEKFLINTGRRKFLSPIYGELIKSESGKEMALNIYKKARPNYHFVATNTLDEMLGFQSN
ncbi:MAG: leukotriene A4 hydrolase C-terminal domain-containing protein [Bacteroidota bacterium]